MGRWTLRLSLGLGLLAALLTSFCSADGNYCLLSKASNCSSCIRSGVGCAYCSDETFKAARCDLTENIRAHGCSAAGIITATSSRKMELAQVYPQQMTMSFLPGEAKELDMEVFAPEKGPLDLYILMDFSNSMSDDLKSLKSMGATLAELVQSLSDDYTIGFGKFVDKVVEPQTDMRPEKLAKPWPDSDPPFSFRNVIPLTGDAESFNSKLQGERISGNLDAPEGGFDAMLQATVCSNQIGWRNHSTHLLVFSTESAFHYENDGANVLSGILPRNDEQCHLDASGGYTQDTTQDYPSVPTLVRLMGEHNIIPIFAVTAHSYDYYEKLQQYFPIAELGLLDEDSSNILSILRSAFISIRSKMSIRAEQLPQAFKAEFLKAGAVAEYGAFKVKPGQIEKFKVRLQAQKKVGEQHVCQLKPDDKAGVTRVKPSTFSQALDIKTELLCPTCPCENTPSPGAARCSTHGDLVCGKCQCYEGWLGAYCNCSASASSLGAAQCLAPGDQLPCSGNGDCLCGTCVCFNPEQHDGAYCQYDKSHCARYGGFLCNDRGSCSLGQCECGPGWGGAACECPKGNSTCVDRKGGICNGRGQCVCGQCECQGSGVSLTSTCEANLEAQVAFCEAKRACVQCQAWKTGENKDNCEACSFKVTMVDELKEKDKVIDTCDFRDETDDCTYYYTVDYPEDKANKELDVQVLKKKECPPRGFLWLIPLIMFLMLLLGLLMLCCWKYCRCCWGACLALLPCCGAGRKVGFTEDEYLLRQSQLTSDHLDTPMVRTGPPKGTDVVRWKVQDNVHRGAHHPEAQVQPSPKETIQFPVSLRLNKKYSDNMSQPDSIDTELLRKDVNDNVSVLTAVLRVLFVFPCRQDRAIVDTVLSAPRSSYPEIVKLTEKNVQSGRFNELRVLPGYYTVATDREASGAIEFQEEVETVDVRVPLFTKEEDDDKKQLKVEAVDVPLGIAAIKKRFVHITIIKEHAKSVFTFLQPAYSYSRQEGIAKIPIRRNISEDGRTQVTYRTRDLTARDKHDYLSLEGDLSYAPGETEKVVPVQLLELGELSNLLDEKQVKQFVMELSNPRQGAKLGVYPTTTVTILDEPDPSVIMFKKVNQAFTATEPSYNIPVVRTRNLDAPATTKWRTKNKLFDQGGTLKFGPGQTEKNIRIEKASLPPGPAQREPFMLELLDPSPNAVVGERKTTMVHIGDGGTSPDVVTMGSLNQKCSSPGGRLGAPPNAKAKSTGPKKIQLSWDPPPGNPMGYKVKYWIYGDPETKAEVVDVTTPQAELRGLYPSCDYEMRVSAYNMMGEGFNTEVIPCKTLEDLPSEPGRLAFNVISPTVTQVSWAEPAETNGDITAYDVVYTPIDDDRKPVGPAKTVKIDNPKKRMLLIENLQRAQTYMYKVRAKNSVGWGPYRDATINLASQPVRPLSIPIIPDIPIVDAEAGDEYDGYLMYSSEVLRSPSGSKTPSVSGEGDQLINGKYEQGFLFPGSTSRNVSSSSSPMSTGQDKTSTTYLSGQGKTLTDVRLVSPYRGNPGVPDTPTRLVFSALGPTALRVSWQEPHCDRDILGYSVLYQQLNGGEDVKRINVSSPGDNSVVVQDLLPNHSYLFKVKAQSQEGWGPEREGVITIESAVDPQSPLSPMPGSPFTLSTPSAPGPLVFTALSPEALQLSWDKPRKPNGDILGYVVTCEQLHGGGDLRSFQVSGDSAETSLTVPNLSENMPYKFKVQARTTQGFGPEREGIITIESQDGGTMSQYSGGSSMTRREVFQMPAEVSSHTNVSHTMFTEPYFGGTMMMTTQHMETSGVMTTGMVTRQVTQGMVQKSMVGGTTVTKKVERFYES
uniref:Integrin beta n=1 Tax=Gadus morhua TaxID=8049 RepID=A0A8C4Z4T8_GADMO